MTRPSPLPTNSKTARLRRLRSLSYLLDDAIKIPGTSHRVGLDPLIGLLPIAGDYLGLVFSAYIVLESALMGLPRASLVRMVVNILLDTLVGAFPIIGDFLDFAWKANTKNIALLEAHLASPQPSQKADWWFLILLFGGLLLLAITITTLVIFIFSQLLRVLSRA